MSEQKDGAPALPGVVTVRAMREEDLEEGLRLAGAAGWNQKRADWRLVQALSPRGNVVALLDGRLAGTTVTLNYGNRVSWIAMVLVDPAARRRGIATRMMNAALEVLAGCDTIKLDATPAGREVYLKLGFVDEGLISRYRAEAAPAPEAALPGTRRIRPMTAADLPAVTALDASVFGTSRAAFLAGLFPMAPAYARVADGPAGLEGFCFGRPGTQAEFLGPLYAPGEAEARALAAAAFRAMGGRPVMVDSPQGQTGFHGWLKGLGFEEQRTFMRMRKGPDVHKGDAARVFGIAGPEFG